MDNRTLHMENLAFSGTSGVSDQTRASGFQPAFKDLQTGRVEIARTRIGLPATCHMIDWLPRDWARTLSHNGRVSSLRSGIISGFVRQGVFFTREELAEL